MAHWIVNSAGSISRGTQRVCPTCEREFSTSLDSLRFLCMDCGSDKASKSSEKINSHQQSNYGLNAGKSWTNQPARPVSFWRAAGSTLFGILAGCAGLFAICTVYLVGFSGETMTGALWLSGILAGIALAISTLIAALCWFAWTVDSSNENNSVAQAGRIIIGFIGIVALFALLTFLWSNPQGGAEYDIFQYGRYVTTAFIENWELALLGTIGGSLWLLMFGFLLIQGVGYFLHRPKASPKNSPSATNS